MYNLKITVEVDGHKKEIWYGGVDDLPSRFDIDVEETYYLLTGEEK